MLAELGSTRSRLAHSRLFWMAALALTALALQAGRAHASGPGTATAVTTTAGVQKLVNKVRKELALTHDVTVELVVHNPLKASVEPVKRVTRKGVTRSFRLSIERAFLEKLTADELRAVVAHELGHVWIYTHHPYLQTEQLANTIAMRVVARESIVKVYGKVWADAGAAGTLPRFSDEPVAAGLGSQRP
jgi:Zn-dependent protease with chaperone function